MELECRKYFKQWTFKNQKYTKVGPKFSRLQNTKIIFFFFYRNKELEAAFTFEDLSIYNITL